MLKPCTVLFSDHGTALFAGNLAEDYPNTEVMFLKCNGDYIETDVYGKTYEELQSEAVELC